MDYYVRQNYHDNNVVLHFYNIDHDPVNLVDDLVYDEHDFIILEKINFNKKEHYEGIGNVPIQLLVVVYRKKVLLDFEDLVEHI